MQVYVSHSLIQISFYLSLREYIALSSLHECKISTINLLIKNQQNLFSFKFYSVPFEEIVFYASIVHIRLFRIWCDGSTIHYTLMGRLCNFFRELYQSNDSHLWVTLKTIL